MQEPAVHLRLSRNNADLAIFQQTIEQRPGKRPVFVNEYFGKNAFSTLLSLFLFEIYKNSYRKRY